jgi:hypothetical protein
MRLFPNNLSFLLSVYLRQKSVLHKSSLHEHDTVEGKEKKTDLAKPNSSSWKKKIGLSLLVYVLCLLDRTNK